MSSETDRLDATVVDTLRNMARQGRRPSDMFREVQDSVGVDTHIATILDYFRHAFCLTLKDVKPLAALSRNERRQLEDEGLLDELLLPVIVNHRTEWDVPEQ